VWKNAYFPKSVKRFSDKKCGKNKELERSTEPSEVKIALVVWRLAVALLVSVFIFSVSLHQGGAQPLSRQDVPPSLSNLAEEMLDAVVNISISQTVKGTQGGDNPPALTVPDGSPFQEFFDDFFTDGETTSRTPARRVESLGSGFVVDAAQGFIVTNNHVIADADEIEAIFTDGTRLKASLVGKDSKTDLALLKIDPHAKHLKQVNFGDSQTAKIGDWVMAIGNPFGLGGTVTLGIISARNRDINSGPYDDFIQTDAAINRGNSGGPLFDMQGQVIGINTAIISPTGGSIGLGFAIPSELAIHVIEQLKQFGKPQRGWLGLRIQPVTEEIATSLNLPEAQGALISGRMPQTGVDNAALLDGDVILRFGDRLVKTARDLPRLVAETPAGHLMDVVVWREGEEKTVQVKLGLLEESDDTSQTVDAPQENDTQAQSAQEISDFLLGMKLAPLTDEKRAEFSIVESVTEGVVVTQVEQNSAADNKRIVAGTVILDINQDLVTTPADVRTRFHNLREMGRKNALMTVVEPSGSVRFVTIRLD